ncbi:hypothetical protein ISF_08880 [Cordyceps fumosorosea ARSEF 2679]|uniref:Uncharacterized protein n=1 Tax=Cordyceps fumosorosea (strain ARSEF 2679) TaxID=1081104 RepID=A0A167LMM4_CORFA|nr:hypothetical protein ISF_08880 [Cordyceps fumosorosea ARSEF 2679]OAA53266.1 hypothetical protein ISF_08880 [Cordyceps fumosorosea ARSEF 2679]
MKFSLPTILALPLVALAAPSPSSPASDVQARDCTIHGQWDSNWVEYGNSRYRVRIWGDGNTKDRWCDFYWKYGSFVTISNPACWVDGDKAISDVSYGRGPIGYEQYKKTFWDAFIAMERETGCKLDVNL